MNVIIEEFEIITTLPPSRLFKGYILDANNLVPKVLPIFKSFETLEGDGGAGTLKKLVFCIGEHDHIVKHRTDELDETNRLFKYTIVEGGDLGDEFESITNTVTVEPGPNGGSIFKESTEYRPKCEDHHKIQETIKRAAEGSKAFFHAVEAYLHANPHEYN